MAAPPTHTARRTRTPHGVLIWIAIYKLAKSTVMLLAGIATLHLRNQDLKRHLVQWVDRVNLDPHRHVATWVLSHVLQMDNRRLSIIGAGFFAYMVLYAIQGYGLYREKRWAEWLTLATSFLLLPIEVYELYRKPRLFKLLVIVTNLAVIGYLLWRLKRDQHRLELLAGKETPLNNETPKPRTTRQGAL